jgi:predicted nucleic acid-binding protein
LFSSGQRLHAPHLIDVEVAHVIRRFAALGEIGNGEALAAFGGLADLPMQRHPHQLLLGRVWELRHNLSAYDAIYVALAELLDEPLITHDKQLANAAGHQAIIELV